MASKGVNQENMQVRRSSSTLGEMLAIPEVKKEEESSRELDVSSSSMSSGGGEDLRTSTACLSITEAKDGANGDASPRNFSRSKSVPVSSTYEKVEMNVEVTKSTSIKATTPKEEMKSKSGKTSFKGKVSSFFFSRNKKHSQEKSNPSSLATSDVSFQSGNREIACKKDDISKGVHISGPEERPVNPEKNSSKGSLPSATVNSGAINSTASAKVALSLEKFSVSETPSETHEQPSPVSVLEAPFADEANISMLQSSQSLHAGRLQMLSRSAPIESIARSLSWDDTYKEISSENPLKLTGDGIKADEEEQEHFNFVQKLLLSAGLDNGSSKNIFSRWHSLDCPLDQILLDRFLDQKEEETKCKAKRSNQRLLFDCVNTALLEIGQAAIYNAYPHARSFEETRKDAPAGTSVAEVWKLVRDKNSAEGKYSREIVNSHVLVDQLVRKEVVGREWTELLWWEFNEISKEVGTKVLEELIGETLSDLTNPCL
ncbi:hypothetical protein J5N97_023267 [Dioscorea zingiberensis]|uniref:DUF4378 domain-containing protein n=1 Tax=Dioscorea zingiberensis TaxID=325984 RepID=A0A9D5CDS0_9LILI|nr:hypothetical protein J5N97_023267 [Dioscorea zingiberensis]